jgi:hypothetical protein
MLFVWHFGIIFLFSFFGSQVSRSFSFFLRERRSMNSYFFHTNKQYKYHHHSNIKQHHFLDGRSIIALTSIQASTPLYLVAYAITAIIAVAGWKTNTYS